jgi:predicted transcriptional regulator
MMQSALKFDPDKEGLMTLFREWQVHTMKFLWNSPMKKFTTKEIWTHVRREAEKEISRATIYHFLDDMTKRGLLNFQTGTGRGGLRILFFSEYTEEEFTEFMAKSLIQSIEENLLGQQKSDQTQGVPKLH